MAARKLANNAYIDNANLHKGFEEIGYSIDYARFRTFLTERYGVREAYMFMGFVPSNQPLYTRLREYGYTLIFKPTVPNSDGRIKGNCDAELVLHAVADYYERRFAKAVIVTSDGDFACLARFLLVKNSLDAVLSPRAGTCSTLLTRSGARITFLPEVAHLIARKH